MTVPDRRSVTRTVNELVDALKVGRFELLWHYSEELRYYLSSFRLENAGSEYIGRYVNDALQRLLRTVTLIPAKPGLRVLEIGASPYVLSILERTFFDHEVSYVNFFEDNIFSTLIEERSQRIFSEIFQIDHQLRFKHFNIELVDWPYGDETFDLVLCCEVLEHLILNPLKIFGEIVRVLRPGGRLILTTPNAVRLVNFMNMLEGKNFFDTYHPAYGRIYGRHNREFTAEEISHVLIGNDFRVLDLKTEDLFDYEQIQPAATTLVGEVRLTLNSRDVRKILSNMGAAQNRGDVIYALAEKPAKRRPARDAC